MQFKTTLNIINDIPTFISHGDPRLISNYSRTCVRNRWTDQPTQTQPSTSPLPRRPVVAAHGAADVVTKCNGGLGSSPVVRRVMSFEIHVSRSVIEHHGAAACGGTSATSVFTWSEGRGSSKESKTRRR